MQKDMKEGMEVKTSRSGRRGANRDGESEHWARRHFKIIKAKREKVKPKEYRG